MATPTPEEAQAKNEHVTTDRAAAPEAAKAINVQTAAQDIVQEVRDAESTYADAKGKVAAPIEEAASPLGKEPALILGTVGTVIVAVLALAHVTTVDTATGFITSAVPLIGSIVTRFFVKPA